MPKPAPLLGWAITFVFVNTAFIFFKSESIIQALHMTASLVAWHQPFAILNLHTLFAGATLKLLALPMLAGIVLAFAGPTSEQLLLTFQPNYRNCFLAAGILVAAFIMINSTLAKQFVYFAF